MVILGVDLGKARTGVAVCDKSELLASPVEVVNEHNRERLLERVAQLAKARRAEQIVVGLPRNMDGSYGFQSEKVRAFADAVLAEWDGEHVFYDERLSTVSAERVLCEAEMNWQKRRKVVDKLAATIILQGYLDGNPKL